ncbi:SseB family protein [Nocardioides speluncae]|uniref:SseB family protein n=1 Tax=Nocardioides speluncae TaxID=2670337 RepID=UPI000D697886|nr:SseB family protein [Nocardioides speluncae]
MIRDNAVLRSEIQLVHAGVADGESLVESLRRSELLVPSAADGAPLTTELDGVLWVLAFTSEQALAVYADARGAVTRSTYFLTLPGSLLQDVALPALGRPGGIAVDLGSAFPMLFPAAEPVVEAVA